MDIAAGFDVHRTIRYHDISKLFWNTYPFKVRVKDPTRRPEWALYSTNRAEWERLKKEYDQKSLKFLYKLLRSCPTMQNKFMDNQRTFSFFFMEEAAALHFIAKNHKHVTDVYRPPCLASITALQADHRNVMREFLFEEAYRWKVVFKRKNDQTDAEIDEWVTAYFDEAPDRAFYKRSKKSRRLFLSEENDVIFVKMGLAEHIDIIEKAILKEEIANEPEAGQDAG